MATLVKHEIKQIHETIDQIEERSWKRPTQNLHHPTRRTWRSLNEDDESVDRYSFVSNRRPSQVTQSFCARIDQLIKDGLQEDKLENIITTLSTIQSPNKKEMVIGFDSSVDTDDEGEADPEMLSEEESDSKMPESNVSCEDVHEVSNEITLISKRDVMQTSDVEDERQKNIFHTRSNVTDKVCSMVTDGGTCTNDVSSIIVEIVGQPVLIHPKSYNSQLLHKSVKVVDMQVKLPLNTDDYKDYVKFQEESEPKKKKKKMMMMMMMKTKK